MIISKTPFRISFFGGGTDYPEWFREYEGAVLSTTIDKYCYITCRYLPPFFEHNSRVVYSKIESVKNFDEIQHVSIRECLKYMGIKKGVEIHHDGDIPARSGIGSSSSFTVGMLNALNALNGKLITKYELAKNAIFVERELNKENVGVQDQIAASFGGFNKILFLKNEEFQVNALTLKQEKIKYFQDHLILYFTGFSRFASEIAKTQIKNIPDKINELKSMYQMVDEAVNILNSNTSDITEFGKLLNESWKLKRSLSSKITNSDIDNIYDEAMHSGAIGGKLLGAGGGGFILFFVKPEHRKRLRERMNKFLQVPFKFENFGSQIVYYNPDDVEE